MKLNEAKKDKGFTDVARDFKAIKNKLKKLRKGISVDYAPDFDDFVDMMDNMIGTAEWWADTSNWDDGDI